MLATEAQRAMAEGNGTTRWTTGELATRLRAELRGPGDLAITRLDAMERADAGTLTFIRDAKYALLWKESKAGAAVVSKGIEVSAPQGRALLVVEDADRALIEMLEALTPPTVLPGAGVDTQASVDPSAKVDPSARLGAFVRVGPDATVGARTTLHAGVTLGAGVRVGADCELRAGVVIEDRCTLGDRVRVHANAVIGADGFGYRASADGKSLVKIPHAGHVEIGDDVEIGANANIDRGKFGPTVIGSGAKIDNLVQIGHNCRVGRCVIICGACGVSGSVTIGDGAVLAGGVGVADNVTIGAGAKVGARSGVMHDIPPGEEWVGYPAQPVRTTMRIIAAQRQLPDLVQQVRRFMRKSGLDS